MPGERCGMSGKKRAMVDRASNRGGGVQVRRGSML